MKDHFMLGLNEHGIAPSEKRLNMRVIAKWGILAFVVAGMTVLFVWDVFFTPRPPSPDTSVVARKYPFVTSRVAINVDVTIVNPTTNPCVYAYVWFGGQMVGRMLDEASAKDSVYHLRLSLKADSISFLDQAWGLRFRRDLHTGPMSMGVTFQGGEGSTNRSTFEVRHDLWLSDSDISIMKQGEGWAGLNGDWTQRSVDGELFVEKVEAWEDEALKNTFCSVAFEEPIQYDDLSRKLAETLPASMGSELALLPIHEEDRYTADVRYVSKIFMITCRVQPMQARLTATERFNILRKALTNAFPKGLAVENMPNWDFLAGSIDKRADRLLLLFDNETQVTPNQIHRILDAAIVSSSFSNGIIWPTTDQRPTTLRPLRDYRMSVLSPRGDWDAELRRLAREIERRVDEGNVH